MRLMPVIAAALVLSTSHLSYAQEWIEFASRHNRFTCLFPGQPKITETTYHSPHEADRPAPNIWHNVDMVEGAALSGQGRIDAPGATLNQSNQGR